MSPNANYNRGTRFERELVNALKACGARASRSAGSHGLWDVVAYVDSMEAHAPISELFEWSSTEQPPHGYEFFDWVAYYPHGRLEKRCYIKVVHSDPDEWVYLIQTKVTS